MGEEYVGVIQNYRLGKGSQRTKECLIRVLGEGAAEAKKLIGWDVGWPSEEPKIRGKIVCPHGRTRSLRARFRKGLPGQALSTRVRISKEE